MLRALSEFMNNEWIIRDKKNFMLAAWFFSHELFFLLVDCQFKIEQFLMRVAHQFKIQNSKFKIRIAAPPLRFSKVFRYEFYFVWREPLGCLPIALGDEGIVEGFATADPRHETVDCHVGCGWREIQEGKLLLGVGLDGECHKWIEALPPTPPP